MSSPAAHFVAADLGASSGRVMLARIGPQELELTQVRRFRNGPVTLPDGLYWDILGLHTDILTGLADAARTAGDIRSVAVDSWAVDYGLLDADGALLSNPHHYRDPRTDTAVIDGVHARISAATLYERAGLQFLPFNTVYQLAAEPHLDRAESALLVPDLIGYWLTGVRACEQTNASTTGLLDARTGRWATDLLDQAGLKPDLLPDVLPPGTDLGPLSAGVRAEVGLTDSTRLTLVGSHDTASAVAGVPAGHGDFAYISCGTWGLVGVELDAPVLTEDSRAANFTNERGVDSTVRYLRNVMGLWLLQESLRTWRLSGRELDLPALLAAAAELPRGGPTFDCNDPVFLPPGDMPARIAELCRRDGRSIPTDPASVTRAILDSLAQAFARSVADAAALSGTTVDVVHIVGGGAQNALLCQLTADACGLTVLAGPVEATALGNVVTQARAAGVLTGDRWQARELIRRSHQVIEYRPFTAWRV